jgi:hypothetical protein
LGAVGEKGFEGLRQQIQTKLVEQQAFASLKLNQGSAAVPHGHMQPNDLAVYIFAQAVAAQKLLV